MKAHGIIVALHTPLTASGEIHEEALRDHLEWMVESGIHGIFPCGTMGEGIALSDTQRKRVAEITVDQVKHRAFVMPQVTTNNTAGCIELSRHAKAAGADAISVIAPYFYPSDGAALDAFFSEIAGSVPDLPVFLYNNPGRSASGIPSSLIGKLVKKVKNIAGIKDSSKDLILFQEYVEVGGEGFACIIGTDGLVYPAMMVVLGTHYLPFVFLYGMWQFAVLAGTLILAGVGTALWIPGVFTLGAWVTSALLFAFAFVGRSAARS